MTMRMFRTRQSAVLIAFAIWLAWPPDGFAQPPVRKNVLVLHTYGLVSPFRSQFDAVLQQTLLRNGVEDADVFEETLESNRFPGDAHAALFREYLGRKYANRKIDVVITVWDRALNYALQYRRELFPDAPLIALVQRQRILPPDIAVFEITVGSQVADTARLALGLHPNTRRIAVVDGTLQSNDDVQKDITDQLTQFSRQVTIDYWRDLPVANLIERVKQLPSDSIILYVRQTLKTPTQAMPQLEGVANVVRAAAVPIYVVSDQPVGHGVVGGVVFRTDSLAKLVAETAIRVMNGTPARDIATLKAPAVPMFDWRQLRRWGIEPDRLPVTSDIRFRDYTFWEQNRIYIAAAVVVFLTQSVLIAGLLVQGTRRRRAERALRANEQELRVSHEDTRRLAGRIIAAQEVERTRIARELHDDVSQKVAMLAMDIDHLWLDAAPEIQQQVNVMAERTAEIGTDLHNLSHELHPAKLQILGLVRATQFLCRDVAARHALKIEFVHNGVPSNVPLDPALCLFRIVQEALQNVVKHSGAKDAVVSLAGTPRSLQLEIADAGDGFDMSRLSGGLGVLSMRERVHFLDGHMTISSTPGEGTRIVVDVPIGPPKSR